MKAVAGVVCDEQNAALVRGGQPHRLQDLLCARGGEDVAAGNGRQETLADEPTPCRLMAGAATADDAHGGPVIAGVGDDTLGLVEDEVGVSRDESTQGPRNKSVRRGIGEVVLGGHDSG